MDRQTKPAKSVESDPGCVKTLGGITAPGILGSTVMWRAKKTRKFVFRSALRPNRISFLHDQDPKRTLAAQNVGIADQSGTSQHAGRVVSALARPVSTNL
jgi:hypothetical protein